MIGSLCAVTARLIDHYKSPGIKCKAYMSLLPNTPTAFQEGLECDSTIHGALVWHESQILGNKEERCAGGGDEQYLGLTVTYLVKQMRTHDSDVDMNIQHEYCRITDLMKDTIDEVVSRVAGLDLWDLAGGGSGD